NLCPNWPPHLIAYPTFMRCRYQTIFFSNHTAPTEIYTLSLHDALPISKVRSVPQRPPRIRTRSARQGSPCIRPKPHTRRRRRTRDRKSTRLNSSHVASSYAVFCLKKKNQTRPSRSPRASVGRLPPNLHR